MAFIRSLNTLLRAPTRVSALTPHHQPITMLAACAYHNTARRRLPYKDDQDRDSVKPKAIEGGTSATDEATADTDAAFDSSKTRPEEEHAAADRQTGKGDDNNPLESSGANPEDSAGVGKHGSAEMWETVKGGKAKSSGHGSPEKKG